MAANRRTSRAHRPATALVLFVALLVTVLVPAPARAADVFTGPVIISEFMASNASGIVDDDGDTSDWIELHNISAAAVDLSGWRLSDSGATYVLPAQPLAPDAHLLVWASGKNRVSAGNIHANFKLSSAGEALTLRDPAGVLASAYDPAYPAQSSDVSYGYDAGAVGWFVTPTPGAANGVPGAAPASPATANVPSGIYNAAQVVTLTSSTPGATIRYTLDGKPPTETSTIADGPITVAPLEGAVTIRSKTYAVGRAPSAEASFSYVFPSATLTAFPDAAQYIPNLPILVINNEVGSELYGTNPPRAGRVDYIDPNGPGFSIGAGLANTGAGIWPGAPDIESIRLHFDAEYGSTELRYPLFSDRGRGTYTPADTFDKIDLRNFSHDGLLLSNFPESQPGFVSDRFWKNTMLDLGELSPHGRYVQVYTGGKYHGMFDMREVFGADFQSQYVPGGKDDHSSVYYAHWSRPDLVNTVDGDRADWDQVHALAADYQAISQHIDVGSFIAQGLFEGWVIGSREQEYRFTGRRWGGTGGEWIVLHNDNDWESVRINTGGNIFGNRGWANDFLYQWTGDADFRAEADDMIRFAFCDGGPMTETAMLDRFNEATAELELAIVPTLMRRYGNDWQTYRGYVETAHTMARGLISSSAADRVRAAQDAGFLDSCDRRPTVDAFDHAHNLVGDTVHLEVSAIDPEGLAVAYSASGLPAGLSIDPASGVISGVPTAAGVHVATITATDQAALTGTTTIEWTVDAAGAAGPLVLNEYNAVASTEQLGDGAGADAHFGAVVGNGGDWLEFVVIEDADLRGMQIHLWDRDRADDRLERTRTLVFSDHALLASVPRGTVLTIAEDAPEDLSFDPATGDWLIQANVDSQAGSALFTPASQANFDTNRHSFHVLVTAADGTPLGGYQGETDTWRATVGNVAGNEVYALCETPDSAAMPLNAARDLFLTSTFGSVNDCDGDLQSFATLRGIDANCSGDHSITDALFIAQFTVGNRADHPSCPLVNPASELNAEAADFNGDGTTDIVDALLIAQCTVGIVNPFCTD